MLRGMWALGALAPLLCAWKGSFGHDRCPWEMRSAWLTFLNQSAYLLIWIIVGGDSTLWLVGVRLLPLWNDSPSVGQRGPCIYWSSFKSIRCNLSSIRCSNIGCSITFAALLLSPLKPGFTWVAWLRLVILIQKLEGHWIVLLIFHFSVSGCWSHQMWQVTNALLLHPWLVSRAWWVAWLRILLILILLLLLVILELSWLRDWCFPIIVCEFLKFFESCNSLSLLWYINLLYYLPWLSFAVTIRNLVFTNIKSWWVIISIFPKNLLDFHDFKVSVLSWLIYWCFEVISTLSLSLYWCWPWCDIVHACVRLGLIFVWNIIFLLFINFNLLKFTLFLGRQRCDRSYIWFLGCCWLLLNEFIEVYSCIFTNSDSNPF